MISSICMMGLLKTNQRDLKEKITRLARQLNELREQCAALQKENEKLKYSNIDKDNNIEELKENIAKMEREQRDLKDELQRMNKRLQEQDDRMDSLVASLQGVKSENSKLRVDSESKEHQLGDSNKSLTAGVEELKAKVDSLQVEVEQADELRQYLLYSLLGDQKKKQIEESKKVKNALLFKQLALDAQSKIINSLVVYP